MIANKTIMLKELTKQLAFFDEKELSDYYFCRGKDLVRETLDTRRKLIEDGVNCGEKFVENIFELDKYAIALNGSYNYKIDEDLVQIFMNTDVEIKRIHLPNTAIFLDCEIPLGEGKIGGMLLLDPSGLRLIDKNGNKKYCKEIFDELGYYIIFFVYDKNQDKYFLHSFNSDKSCFEESQMFFSNEDITKKDIDLNKKFRKKVIQFTQSFLKFIYNPDVHVCEKEYSPIRIKRKAQQGKFVEDHHYLKITGKTRKYLDSFDRNSFTRDYLKSTYSWVVRGYYRLLSSPKFKNKQGQEIFIPPFVKGMGELKNREYICSDKSKIWKNELLMKNLIGEIFPEHLILANTRGFLDGLEIDCYIPDLKLGFEYNGKQHYEQVDIFHRDEGDLKNQIKRDKRKRRLAKERGITLITIKYDDPLNLEFINSKLKNFKNPKT